MPRSNPTIPPSSNSGQPSLDELKNLVATPGFSLLDQDSGSFKTPTGHEKEILGDRLSDVFIQKVHMAADCLIVVSDQLSTRPRPILFGDVPTYFTTHDTDRGFAADLQCTGSGPPIMPEVQLGPMSLDIPVSVLNRFARFCRDEDLALHSLGSSVGGFWFATFLQPFPVQKLPQRIGNKALWWILKGERSSLLTLYCGPKAGYPNVEIFRSSPCAEVVFKSWYDGYMLGYMARSEWEKVSDSGDSAEPTNSWEWKRLNWSPTFDFKGGMIV